MKIAVPYKNGQVFQNFVTPHSSRSTIIHNYASWQGVMSRVMRKIDSGIW